jgi:glycosyltransferase involved in cell wall biosynthesis
MVGTFGMQPKMTMTTRALAMGQALARRGHEVTLVVPPWSWPEDSGREWVDGGVRVVNIALPGSGVTPVPARKERDTGGRGKSAWMTPPTIAGGHATITSRLARRALAGRPEVIHCFKPKAYAGLVAMLVPALRGLGQTRARLVLDTDDWEGPGGWNEIEPYPRLAKQLFAWQERWLPRRSDAVTVASRALETLMWSLGVPPAQTLYVPNGLRPAFERLALTAADRAAVRERLGLGEARVVVLYTSHFFEFTVERAMDVLARIARRAPGARFLVMGKGRFGEDERMRRAAARSGLEGRLVFPGWLDLADVPAHLAAADVALHLYDDTLVNRTKCSAKLLELMAVGLAVVAEEVGQNGATLRDGESGRLIAPGDAEALAATVAELLADPAAAARLGSRARRQVLGELTWDRLVEQVEAAYRAAGVRA